MPFGILGTAAVPASVCANIVSKNLIVGCVLLNLDSVIPIPRDDVAVGCGCSANGVANRG